MSTVDSPAPSTPSLKQRLVRALLMLVLALPLAGGLLGGGGDGARGAGFGAMFGLIIAMRSGWLRAAQLAPGLLVGIVAGAATATGWPWVVLLALVALLAGPALALGYLAPVAIIGMATASSRPPESSGGLLNEAVFLVVLPAPGMTLTENAGTRLLGAVAGSRARSSWGRWGSRAG